MYILCTGTGHKLFYLAGAYLPPEVPWTWASRLRVKMQNVDSQFIISLSPVQVHTYLLYNCHLQEATRKPHAASHNIFNSEHSMTQATSSTLQSTWQVAKPQAIFPIPVLDSNRDIDWMALRYNVRQLFGYPRPPSSQILRRAPPFLAYCCTKVLQDDMPSSQSIAPATSCGLSAHSRDATRATTTSAR